MGKLTIRTLYEKSVRLTRQSPNLAASDHGQQTLLVTEAGQLPTDTRLSPSGKGRRSIKTFFTFRKKTPRIHVTEPTDQPVTVNAIANEVDDYNASSLRAKTPNLTKISAFASPFLRRSMPSWAGRSGRRVRSVPLDFCSPDFMDSLSSTTSSADADVFLRRPRSSFERPYDSTTTFSMFDTLSMDEKAAQLHRSLDWNQPATVPAPLTYASTASETRISVMMLPAPPIIVSSPTPPNFSRFEAGELQVIRDMEVLDSELESRAAPDGICKTLETVQKVARQLEHDATFSEGNVYRFTAPILVFLYMLAMAVILPRRQAEIVTKLGVDEGYTLLCFLLLTVLGVPFVLMALKATLWVMGRLCQSFCTLDVQEVFGKGVCVDSNGERASDADLIVGNLLGTGK